MTPRGTSYPWFHTLIETPLGTTIGFSHLFYPYNQNPTYTTHYVPLVPLRPTGPGHSLDPNATSPPHTSRHYHHDSVPSTCHPGPSRPDDDPCPSTRSLHHSSRPHRHLQFGPCRLDNDP